MKLKYIFLASLIVLGVSSCKDDSNDPDGPTNSIVCELSVKVRTNNPVTTKVTGTDPNELEGEAYLNNLAVLVFNEAGTQLLGSKYETLSNTEGTAIIPDVPVSSAEKAQILIVANVPQSVINTVSSLSDFQSQVLSLSSQGQANLTMSSQVITTTKALEGGDNYIGYTDETNINDITTPVLLTRNVARLQIQNFKTEFAGSALAGRTVTVNYAYAQNIKTQSKYFSVADWGAIELPGNLSNQSQVNLGSVIDDNTTLTSVPYRYYVMENSASTDAATQIVVNATIAAGGGYQAQTKTFVATINPAGLTTYGHNYIKRNYVYKMYITFSSTSFTPDPNPVTPVNPDQPEPVPVPDPTPDTQSLEVAVQIVAWGNVNQHNVVD